MELPRHATKSSRLIGTRCSALTTLSAELWPRERPSARSLRSPAICWRSGTTRKAAAHNAMERATCFMGAAVVNNLFPTASAAVLSTALRSSSCIRQGGSMRARHTSKMPCARSS